MKAQVNAGMLILILFFIGACKKTDTPPATQKTYLSKAIYSAVVGTYTYTYDAAGNMLTEVNAGGTSNPAYTTSFTNYDVMGRVTEFVTDFVSAAIPDEKSVVSFNASGKLDRVFVFQVNGGPVLRYYTFEYPAGKQIEKDYNNANVLTNSYEYTLSADGKNVVESKSFNAASVLRSTQAYSNFDTKKSNDLLFPVGYNFFPTSENNFQTRIATNNITSVVTTYTYTFEYNSDGYVTKITANNGSIISYEYIKR